VHGLLEFGLVRAADEHRVEHGLHGLCERVEVGGWRRGHAKELSDRGMVLRAIVSREGTPDRAEFSL